MTTPTTISSKRTDGTAIASLVLAMLSFVIGPFGFIPAIICGHVSRSRLRRDASLAGGGLAMAGLVISYSVLALSIVVCFLLIVSNVKSG